MPIISFSISQELLNEIESIEKQKRSDFIRKAISNLVSEQKTNNDLKGTIDAILLIKHPEKNSENIMKIRHHHQELIQTHLHTHLENHQCLELLMLKGRAEKIKEMTKALESSKKATLVKLNVL